MPTEIKTIDDYALVTTPAGTDMLICSQGGITRRQSVTQLRTVVSPAASTTVTGLIEIDTDAEAIAGTDTSRAVTAANLKAVLQALGFAVNMAKGADIASAASIDIGAATGNIVDITGSTQTTTLGTVQTGTRRTLMFTGAVPLIHNATAFKLPGRASFTTVEESIADVVSLGAGNWEMLSYNNQLESYFRRKWFRSYQSLAQTITNATWTKLTLNTETSDNFGVFDSVTNYRLIIPADEVWVLHGLLQIETDGTWARKVAIYKNGILQIPGSAGYANAAAGNPFTGSLTNIFKGNGADYFELYVFHNQGGNISTTAGGDATNFFGFKI